MILVAVLVDMALYYFAPNVLAPLAYIPMGNPIYIQLDRREREGLVEPVEGESGYRERRPERIAVERLSDEQILGKRYIAWIRPVRGTIVARTKFGKGFGGMGLIRTRLHAQGDQIVATTRQLPCPAWILPLILVSGIFSPSWVVVAIGLGAFALQVLLPRHQLAQAREESIEHFRSMIHSARKKRKKRATAAEG